jgi:hypothetical protein
MADQHVVESTDKANLRRRATAPDTQPGSAGQDVAHPMLRLQSLVGNASIARLIAQRQAEDDELQAKHDDEVVGVEGGPVGPDTASRIQAMRGGGAPLEDGTLASMEANFGTSFGDVRVHADHESDRLNRRLTARAFTTGSDIFLRRDANPSDTRLMAHELSHVVQQRSMSSGGAGMRVGAADDNHEQHADSIADVLSAAPAGQAPVTLAQREGEEDELQASHDLAQREGEEEDLS